jgi:hypothetical protein
MTEPAQECRLSSVYIIGLNVANVSKADIHTLLTPTNTPTMSQTRPKSPELS